MINRGFRYGVGRLLDAVADLRSGYNTAHGIVVLPQFMPHTAQAKVRFMVSHMTHLQAIAKRNRQFSWAPMTPACQAQINMFL